MLLEGKKVLVTGASGGIGKCLVSTFAKEGAGIAMSGHITGQIIEVAGGMEGCVIHEL